MLKLLLIFSLLLIQLSFSAPATDPSCTPAETKNVQKCESQIIDLIKNLAAAKTNTPTGDTLGILHSECKKTIACVGKNKCTIFVDNVEKPCGLIEPVADAVSCFSNVTTLIQKTPEKYPCLKENKLDLNSEHFLCKLMTTAKPCFENITKQICGEKTNLELIHKLAQPNHKCT